MLQSGAAGNEDGEDTAGALCALSLRTALVASRRVAPVFVPLHPVGLVARRNGLSNDVRKPSTSPCARVNTALLHLGTCDVTLIECYANA